MILRSYGSYKIGEKKVERKELWKLAKCKANLCGQDQGMYGPHIMILLIQFRCTDHTKFRHSMCGPHKTSRCLTDVREGVGVWIRYFGSNRDFKYLRDMWSNIIVDPVLNVQKALEALFFPKTLHFHSSFLLKL